MFVGTQIMKTWRQYILTWLQKFLEGIEKKSTFSEEGNRLDRGFVDDPSLKEQPALAKIPFAKPPKKGSFPFPSM